MLYFIMTTSTTIGYGGDYTPNLDGSGQFSIYFTMMLEVFGIMFLTYWMALIKNIALTLFILKWSNTEKLEKFEEWITIREINSNVVIPLETISKIKKFFYYIFRNNFETVVSEKMNFYAKLPEEFRSIISSYCIIPTVKVFETFFKGKSIEFRTEFITKLKPLNFKKDEFVIKRGGRSKGLY